MDDVRVLVRYVFCDVDSGEIMCTLTADHDVGSLHVPPGQVAFESLTATAATHYSDGYLLHAYTPEQAACKAARPAHAARWSNATMQWQDLRTFDGVRDESAQAVLRRMAEAESSQMRPLRDHAALGLIASPTPEQLAALEVEAARLTAAYALMLQLRTKLAAINAATTQTELDAANALPPL